MKHERNADRLDVAAFAREGQTLEGVDAFGKYPRLEAEATASVAGHTVRWSAQGELRAAVGRPHQPWLRLLASASLPMVCQRCLEPVDVALEADRRFRFVADEDTAASEDEDAEEDVLAIEADFSLRRLIEDELLLAMPVVPLHDVCPVAVKLAVADPGFEAGGGDKKNPFAALRRLRPTKGS